MIGKLRMVYWIDVGERLWYWKWREHRQESGGGWSLDGGVHFADLMRYHVGEVKRMYAEVRAFQPFRYQDRERMEGRVPVDVEDTTMAVLEFENGALGQWTHTSAAPGQEFSRRVIYGDSGSIDFSEGLKTRAADGQQTLKELVAGHQRSIGEEEKERLFPRGVTDTVATELWEFLEAVRGKGKVEIDGWEGFKSQAVCEALYESAAVGGPVTLGAVEALEVENYQRQLNESLGLPR
jgi:predicted dehydrogenase